MEANCGAALFERHGRGIKLTEAGQVLLKWARRLRLDEQDARRELAAMGQGLQGSVRLGIVPTAAQFLLPPVARQLLQEAPKVTLHTVVGLVDTLKPQLRAGDLDLMVATEGASDAGWTSQLLAEDAIVVAAAERHPIFRLTPTLKELSGYAWALQPPGLPTRDWLDHMFDRHRLPRPQVRVETTSLMALPALIVQTGLLSFISRHHLQGPARIRGLKEVPVKGATMRRRLVLTHRAQGFMPPAAVRLMELFLAQAPGEFARVWRN